MTMIINCVSVVYRSESNQISTTAACGVQCKWGVPSCDVIEQPRKCGRHFSWHIRAPMSLNSHENMADIFLDIFELRCHRTATKIWQTFFLTYSSSDVIEQPRKYGRHFSWHIRAPMSLNSHENMADIFLDIYRAAMSLNSHENMADIFLDIFELRCHWTATKIWQIFFLTYSSSGVIEQPRKYGRHFSWHIRAPMSLNSNENMAHIFLDIFELRCHWTATKIWQTFFLTSTELRCHWTATKIWQTFFLTYSSSGVIEQPRKYGRYLSWRILDMNFFWQFIFCYGWCNRGCGICCLWDGAYKRTLAANPKKKNYFLFSCILDMNFFAVYIQLWLV